MISLRLAWAWVPQVLPGKGFSPCGCWAMVSDT